MKRADLIKTMDLSVDENRLKQLLKEAIVEALEEHPEVLGALSASTSTAPPHSFPLF